LFLFTLQEMKEFAAIAKETGVLAIDTEFMSGKTYYAQLCLIQVASGDRLYMIDPFTIEDLSPLVDILLDSGIVKILHAAYQDMELLTRICDGIPPSPVFDTQIAATLIGLPSQIGYARLVSEMMNVNLDKSETFTDWSRRPITDKQIEYALNDVLYLQPIYEKIRHELTSLGRLNWLDEDFKALSAPNVYDLNPQDMYKKIKRASSLHRRQLAVLQEITAWRENEARHRNIPRQWIIKDESLIEIARRKPVSVETLDDIRGISLPNQNHMKKDLITAVKKGLAMLEDELPMNLEKPRIIIDDESVVKLMAALVRNRSVKHGIAVTLLASQSDLEQLAAGYTIDNPLFHGWRKTMIGDDLQKLLNGKLSMRIVEGSVVVDEVL